MKRFLFFCILAFSVPAFASIAFVTGATGGTGCTTNTVVGSGTCPIVNATTTADAWVQFFRPEQSAVTPYASDNNLFYLSQGASIPFNTGYGLVGFAGLAYSGTTGYTVTGMATANSIVGGEYSGVLSIDLNPAFTCPGNTVTGGGCTGTGTLSSETVTLDEANDYAVCGITQGGTNGGGTIGTPFTGTVRETYSSAPAMALVDNTSATTSVVVAGTWTASTTWREACIVVRTVANPSNFNMTQFNPTGYGSLTGPTNCTVTSVNCQGSNATTTAGALQIGRFSDHSDFNDINRTVTSFMNCASPPCSVSLDTWVFPGGQCQGYVQDSQPESDSEQIFYSLSGVGGATGFNAVRSGANATAERQIYILKEFIPPSGQHWVFDGCTSLPYVTAASSFTMPNVTLVNPPEIIDVGFTGGVAPESITSPYLQGESIPQHQANWITYSSSGTGAVVTVAGASNGGVAVIATFYLVPNPSINAIVRNATLKGATVK
jgi:hypothetical protein